MSLSPIVLRSLSQKAQKSSEAAAGSLQQVSDSNIPIISVKMSHCMDIHLGRTAIREMKLVVMSFLRLE